MKKIILIIPLFITTFLLAEEFIVKKNKKTPSHNKTKEIIANELGEIMKFASQNHKFLAKMQERSLKQTYSLLEGNFSIKNKEELKKYSEKLNIIKKELEEQNNFLKKNYKTIGP
jgi:hypothetical protein